MENFLNNPDFDRMLGAPLKTFGGAMFQQLLHTKFPNDFEYYLVAVEVRDYGASIDKPVIKGSLIFPVNPERIILMEKKLSKLTKTFKGVVINEFETFVPFPINLSGTFGRKLRMLYGSKLSSKGAEFDATYKAGVQGKTLASFKTGYGVLKELQHLFQLSRMSNEKGKPYRTIFYNLMFSSVYIVELQEFKPTMTQDKNRLWYYDLQMMVVSPYSQSSYEELVGDEMKRIMTYNAIEKGLNKFIDNSTITLNSYLSRLF